MIVAASLNDSIPDHNLVGVMLRSLVLKDEI